MIPEGRGTDVRGQVFVQGGIWTVQGLHQHETLTWGLRPLLGWDRTWVCVCVRMYMRYDCILAACVPCVMRPWHLLMKKSSRGVLPRLQAALPLQESFSPVCRIGCWSLSHASLWVSVCLSPVRSFAVTTPLLSGPAVLFMDCFFSCHKAIKSFHFGLESINWDCQSSLCLWRLSCTLVSYAYFKQALEIKLDAKTPQVGRFRHIHSFLLSSELSSLLNAFIWTVVLCIIFTSMSVQFWFFFPWRSIHV